MTHREKEVGEFLSHTHSERIQTLTWHRMIFERERERSCSNFAAGSLLPVDTQSPARLKAPAPCNAAISSKAEASITMCAEQFICKRTRMCVCVCACVRVCVCVCVCASVQVYNFACNCSCARAFVLFWCTDCDILPKDPMRKNISYVCTFILAAAVRLMKLLRRSRNPTIYTSFIKWSVSSHSHHSLIHFPPYKHTFVKI